MVEQIGVAEGEIGCWRGFAGVGVGVGGDSGIGGGGGQAGELLGHGTKLRGGDEGLWSLRLRAISRAVSGTAMMVSAISAGGCARWRHGGLRRVRWLTMADFLRVW